MNKTLKGVAIGIAISVITFGTGLCAKNMTDFPPLEAFNDTETSDTGMAKLNNMVVHMNELERKIDGHTAAINKLFSAVNSVGSGLVETSDKLDALIQVLASNAEKEGNK